MSLTKEFYHDLICEQQNPEYDQYNYDVLAEQEYFDKQMQLQMASAREQKFLPDSRSLGTSKGTIEVTIN